MSQRARNMSHDLTFMELYKVKEAIFNEIIIENITRSFFNLSLPVSFRLPEQAKYSFVLKSI